MYARNRSSFESKGITNRKLLSCLFALLLVPCLAFAQEYEIPWHTVDAGGEVFSTDGEWILSGTIGQWDVDTEAPAEGGSLSLTGGFWALDAPESDLLFKDGYES